MTERDPDDLTFEAIQLSDVLRRVLARPKARKALELTVPDLVDELVDKHDELYAARLARRPQ